MELLGLQPELEKEEEEELSQEKPRDFQPSQLRPQSRKARNDDGDDGEVVEVEEKHDEFVDHALEVLEQDDHHEDLDVQNLLGKH